MSHYRALTNAALLSQTRRAVSLEPQVITMFETTSRITALKQQEMR
jgi:hypothetical protein